MTNIKTIEATLLFLLRDNQILLAMKKRGFGAGLYNGVGGKIDVGETIEQAAIRECQEEIGVTPKNLQKVADLFFTFTNEAKETQQDMKVTAFVSREWDGQPTETEEMAPKWFNLVDIPFDQMWQDDPYWLPIVLAGKSVTGIFIFDDKDNLQDATIKNALFD